MRVGSDKQNQKLYTIVNEVVPKSVVTRKNNSKSWKYGYNEEYDFVCISKTGMLGDIYEIQGLRIGLPKAPDNKDIYSRSSVKKEQYWERYDDPDVFRGIDTIHDWNAMPMEFRESWMWYIDREWDRRSDGFWFMNNGIPTYITGKNFFYLRHSKIDVGYPDFREANRVFWIFWEGCIADDRCFGLQYLKIRRSGFSFMAASEGVESGAGGKKRNIGLLSKTNDDAKDMFTEKIGPINSNLPFYFKPIQEGTDKSKTAISYALPAVRITMRNLKTVGKEKEGMRGLDSKIDYKSTKNNSYDGKKLYRLLHDESAKWPKGENIKTNWRVTKTCLRVGRKIIGKCMMGSTCNALAMGGQEFKDLYYASDPTKRNENGQTQTGMYKLFIPMEYNMEGFIDIYGEPVLYTPDNPVLGVDGEMITQGAIDFWEKEADGLKGDGAALNEFYRQYPRTEAHAFRDDSNYSLFNIARIYDQIDYNDQLIMEHHLTRGSFRWKDGVKGGDVVWYPNESGRFLVSWIPPAHMQNKRIKKGGMIYPGNEEVGAFGADSYDISGVVGGGGSKGAIHGATGFNMSEDIPSNQFFLEYVARPQTAEIFYEDVAMAIVFYGMPILCENNKPRLLYYLKNMGLRGYSMNRPDKEYSKLSKAEKELGGIPSSEAVIHAHANSLEAYIEQNVGFDEEGNMRYMPFNETLKDWAAYDISNRTKFDATVSSGLADMAVNKHRYQPQKTNSKISINFARYNNSGIRSSIIQ